jgi:hypothetical protein
MLSKSNDWPLGIPLSLPHQACPGYVASGEALLSAPKRSRFSRMEITFTIMYQDFRPICTTQCANSVKAEPFTPMTRVSQLPVAYPYTLI